MGARNGRPGTAGTSGRADRGSAAPGVSVGETSHVWDLASVGNGAHSERMTSHSFASHITAAPARVMMCARMLSRGAATV